jgi:hypothetical protein
MRLLPLLAVLTISTTATSCGSSLPLLTPDPPQLQAAEARVDKALDCPQPPPVLSLCQDGSLPLQTQNPDGTPLYSCRWPQLDAELASGVPLREVLSDTIGALRKEADLRFEGQHWDDRCRAQTPGAKKPS